MANALGNAAHQLDTDIATLQTDLATYLAAGGSARDFFELLKQKLMQTSGHTTAMTNIILKGPKGRPSPAWTANKTLASLTPGSTYP
jgi:hypothetical protein